MRHGGACFSRRALGWGDCAGESEIFRVSARLAVARRSSDETRTMAAAKFIEELNARLSELFAASPAKDLERNVKATMTAAFARMDLVTREEFDVQAKVLARTREKLAELERRVAELEAAAPRSE